METWKPVVGWETFYEVSDLGNVRSASHTILVNDHGRSYYKPIKSKLLKQSKHSAGYPVVRLTTQNGTKLCYVHRLVAEAFIPNPNNYDCINHKDENKQNNVVSNLEWCTKQYNNTYGTFRDRQRVTLLKTLNKRRNYGH